MKNLKKVLAMVLAFACTFSMFAGAKVFEDVPAGSDYSEAVTMLSDLGIIQGKDDGKYHPEDTITRAEACAMIARLMTGDPNVSQYVGAQSFTDVAKGSWKDSAIGYCYINGIVIGVGDNKFEPDRAITDAEFITMVVRAMGYETADMKQNYPYSYMSNAQAIGLLDGTNMVASTDALRGEDAQVIYNALFTDYARGAKLVNTTHGTSVETYPTLAESVWGLERAAVGTWNEDKDEDATLQYCDAHTWVVLGADPDNEGRILAYAIDDDDNDIYTENKDRVTYSFKYDGDASAVAGYQVELWGEGSHGAPEWDKNDDAYVWSDNWTIKAIKTVKGQTAYDYNASMADSKSDNGTIELEDASLDLDAVAANAKQYAQKYSVDQYVADKYNGKDIEKAEDVEEALNVRDGAQYKLMDWDSDGDIDWVVVSAANYYKVEAVSSSRVTVSAMKAGNEETSTASDSDTWKLGDTTTIDGTDYKFVTEEDLAEGDIIEVTYAISSDDDKELVTATITKVESETAELDKVSTKDTLELTFNGEVKKIAEANAWGDTVVPANPKTYGDFDDEELGTEFALYMNRNGFIVYSDYSTDTSNYLMVLDTGDGSDKTGDRKLATMDVLFADNSVKKDVEVVSDLDLDGYDEDKDGNEEARAWNEHKVVGNVYKYWMNEDGVITKMEPMFSHNVAKDSTYSNEKYSYDESADRLKEGTNNSYVASLEEAKVLFAVMGDYIQEDDGVIYDLKVDAGDVLAVKQDDIPDIGVKTDDYTQPTQLVAAGGAYETKTSWLGNSSAAYIAEVNGNGEAEAAILGVNSFNKFNAASTNVGLVTSVSYDKNDVVEIEVAYKGEVTTVKSAEKVDFDDVVKAYDYNATTKTGTDKDLSSTKDTLGNDLTNEGLATYLKDNAAYAEITTNADGVLTNVTFMDKADNNTVIGHYYQVSRNVIGDITNGNVAYGEEDYYFYDDENLYSVGRLEVKDNDLADDVYYYTIDGTPTIHDTKSSAYTDEMLSVLNGFDGTPDIKAESESNLNESYVNNEYDKADTYEVADLVSKIGGDIVAAYTFEDALGEYPTVAKIVLDEKEYAVEAPTYGKTNSVVVGWTELGGINVNSVKFVGEQPTGVTLSGDAKDNKVTVSVDSTVAVDEIKLSLKDADGKELTQVTIKVTKNAENTLTVTPVAELPELTALTVAGQQKFADIKVNGEVGTANVKIMKDGKDVTADFNVATKSSDGTLMIGTKATTPAGPATVVISKAGYPTYEMPIDVAKADVTLADAGTFADAAKVTVKVGGNDIGLDSASDLTVKVIAAGTTKAVEVTGTWTYDNSTKVWRFAPANSQKFNTGDTVIISLAEGDNYNAVTAEDEVVKVVIK